MNLADNLDHKYLIVLGCHIYESVAPLPVEECCVIINSKHQNQNHDWWYPDCIHAGLIFWILTINKALQDKLV